MRTLPAWRHHSAGHAGRYGAALASRCHYQWAANAVRKHLSGVSGGQLARVAAPANVLSLILSDVTGSPLDAIASGPTVPDPTTFADALAVLARYGKWRGCPLACSTGSSGDSAGEVAETPKPGDPLFRNVTNLLVASNVLAVEAAAGKARTLGFNTSIVSRTWKGPRLAWRAGAAAAEFRVRSWSTGVRWASGLPSLRGGETTVTVRGQGIGGATPSSAFSAALALEARAPRRSSLPGDRWWRRRTAERGRHRGRHYSC